MGCRVPYVIYLGLTVAAAAIVAAWRRQRNRAVAVAFGAFGAVSIAAMLVFTTGRGTPFGDFDKAYYAAGKLVRTAPAQLYSCANADGLCFVNVPIVALAFAPLARLSPPTAHAIVAAGSAAAVAIAVWALIALTGAAGWRRFAVVALVLLNGPLFYSLRLGNLTHVVLALLVVTCICLTSDRDAIAGVLLGKAAALARGLPSRIRNAHGCHARHEPDFVDALLLFLLVLLAAYAARAVDLPYTRWWRAWMAVSALLVSAPVALWVPAQPVVGAIVARVALSHYVFGALLLCGGLATAPFARLAQLEQYERVAAGSRRYAASSIAP